MIFHLSGNIELRNEGSGFCGSEVCKKVPGAIAERAKDEIRQKISDDTGKAKRSSAAAEISNSESEERAASMKQKTLPGTMKPISKIKADNSVSDFFDGTGTPHSVVDSYFFRTMIENIQAAGPRFILNMLLIFEKLKFFIDHCC
jgi:hypothetical protein